MTKIFDNVVVSLDVVKKAVVFLEKRWRQRWLIRMQIYAAYNATLLTVSIYNIQYIQLVHDQYTLCNKQYNVFSRTRLTGLIDLSPALK